MIGDPMRKIVDRVRQYISLFDEESGFYIRSGIFRDGKETAEDPFMAGFPELLDVGIMGHCTHGLSGLCRESGVQCYQDGWNISQPNMSTDDFLTIARQCQGRSYQFALGGRGDPDQHEEFESILRICREYEIVPNFTSSGLGFDEEIIRLCGTYCGAVAISWYGQLYTKKAIKGLIDAGVKTNIHFVLSRESVKKAKNFLRDEVPTGVNAVIFLLHKPIGLGRKENLLLWDNGDLRELFRYIDEETFPFKIGFDSCSVPGLLPSMKRINVHSLDTCEAARWSAYVTPDMKLLPCSFDNQEERWAVDLRNHTIEEAWNSPEFVQFRSSFLTSCPDCGMRKQCMGGCPICPEIVLCEDKMAVRV